MTLYDFLRQAVGCRQEIAIFDYSKDVEAGARQVYEGLCWRCPYTEPEHKDDVYSKMKVDEVEAIDNVLYIGIGVGVMLETA